MSDVLDAALELTEVLGWQVFPCRPGTKVPATAHGFKDATVDPDQLRRWFDGTGCNLAVSCGPSAVVVVDVDDPAAWESFAAGRSYETCESSTPRGGRHLWFTAPDFAVRNSAGKLAPGVDVRGVGGYVVVCPSVTPTGPYEWVNSMVPQPLPCWLADEMRPPAAPAVAKWQHRRPRGRGYGEAALAGEVDRVRSAVAGTRNHTLNEAAFKLGTLVGAGSLDAETVARELVHAALAAGLSEHEAEQTIRSGLTAGFDHPRAA